MKGTPSTFWGKLRQDENGAVTEWHPLLDHCCDVAAVVEALLTIPLWRQRIARVSSQPELDPVTCARLCVLAGMHDFGKFTIPFQAKGRTDLGSVTGGHVEEAIAALSDQRIGSCFEPLGAFGDAAFGLLVSAVGHHGQPRAGGAHQSTRWAPRENLDPRDGLVGLVAKCKEWFPTAFRQGVLLPESAALEHAFAGLVMLADWLGSDPSFFPYSDGSTDRMAFARPQAHSLVAQMFLEVPPAARGDGTDRGPFARVTTHTPQAAQRAILGLPDAPSGSIAVLESETGSGKTEAALAHFVRLYARGEVDGLYVALPTRTAATQIFRRVSEAVTRAFSAPPPVVLAVPGYLRVDAVHGTRLAPFTVMWPDTDRFRYRAWAAEGPKRYLAGAVVVGTVDQVLLSSLMVGHAHLRATSLLRHLLVVDEVHASDDYMTRILEDVLGRHAKAGGHALLLSATLGGEARARLLLAGEGTRPATPWQEASSAPYPLVSHRSVSAGETVRTIPVVHDGRSREIAVSCRALLEDVSGPARCAVEAARAGAKVLVLKNTVAECVATQLAVEALAGAANPLLFSCSGVAAPHHGRFAKDDRGALDDALETRIGKARGDGGVVVVATQTVQQSLDIDVDLLLTDLCPIDVLLQRVGRLHRHERKRPRGFEEARVIVLVPTDRDLSRLIRADGSATHHHGLGSVYPDLRVLEATWRVIERQNTWRIPEESRSLVEQCLHSSRLDAIVEELGPRFDAHRSFLQGTLLGHRRLAELNLVDWSKPYSTMSFPTALDERIKTRLGEEDRRVCFESSFQGPFGRPVRELVIRAAWARGASAEAGPEGLRTEGGATAFRFGAKQFLYDRLGLRVSAAGMQLHKEKHDDDGP